MYTLTFMAAGAGEIPIADATSTVLCPLRAPRLTCGSRGCRHQRAAKPRPPVAKTLFADRITPMHSLPEKQVGETAPLRRPARRFRGSVRAGYLNTTDVLTEVRHGACDQSRVSANRHHLARSE